MDDIEHITASGWTRCLSIKRGVEARDLPVPTRANLLKMFSAAQRKRATDRMRALQNHFKGERFSDTTRFGLLLVPDPERLDTRGAVPPELRRDQAREPLADFVDDRLPEGKVVTLESQPWTLFATVVSSAGLSCGSYEEVVADQHGRFIVDGADTRDFMVRQLWGARVLQSGQDLPDSTVQAQWTSTLFPGEALVDGQAVSGTILHNKVRFRLGRKDRGIGPMRVCPALRIE